MDKTILNSMTREGLRDIAKSLDIPRGRNKQDTISNLLDNWSKVEKEYDIVFERKPNIIRTLENYI